MWQFKLFLGLRFFSDFPTVFGTNLVCLPTPHFARIFFNIQNYFPNHWSIQIFLTAWKVPKSAHSDWIRRDTKYFSVFSPNAGKYGPEKTPYLDTFHAVFTSGVGPDILMKIVAFAKIRNTITTKSTPISPSPETMRKLCLSVKFPRQEIRWNYGTFRSDCIPCFSKSNDFQSRALLKMPPSSSSM